MTSILDEGIRQKCLWSLSKELFWAHIGRYSRTCLEVGDNSELDLEACSQSVRTPVYEGVENIWDKVEQCYINSFEKPSDKKHSVNKLLKGDDRLWVDSHVVLPAMVIGKYLVRGSYSPIGLGSAICDSFITPPAAICSDLQTHLTEPITLPPEMDQDPVSYEEKIEENGFLSSLFLLLIGCGILGGCYILARWAMARGLNKQLRATVDNQVHDYMRMRQEGSISSAEN